MIANEHANRHGAVRELLPWFVSGTLEGDELALVREHLDGCAQCREDVAWQQRLRASPPSPPPGLDPERALARLMAHLEPRENLAGAGRGEAGHAPEDSAAAAAVETTATGPAAARPAPGLGPIMSAPAASEPVASARRDRAPASAASTGWLAALAARWRCLWSGGGWMPWALAGQGVLIAGLLVQLVPQEAQEYRALSSGAQPAAGQLVVMFRPEARLAEVQGMLQAHGARVVDGPTTTGAYVLDVPPARQAPLMAALRASPAVQLAEPLGAGRAP